MNTFTVNNITYTAKPFDFNLVCDLEDMGINLQQANEKPMSAVRAYFALCTGRGKAFSGEQIEQHIINGGNFEEIMSAMSQEMEKSDFFRSLNKNKETENTEDSGKKRTKKEV